MTDKQRISRRTVLKGFGTALALPTLDSMLPVRARAESAALQVLPRRLVFIYVPNGVHIPDWTPSTVGRDFDLPPILAPLAAHKNSLTVFSGLAQDKGRANGDGPGDHARALSSFLTGCQAYKTDGEHPGRRVRGPGCRTANRPSHAFRVARAWRRSWRAVR